jgi:hypothetical protein
MIEHPTARLHAIIAVDDAHAFRCQHTGCGHKVYAAVHIVQEAGKFLVLGSSCFAKRYGTPKALGSSMHGTGNGRRLTDQERALLEANTADLIAFFEEQDRLAQEQQRIAAQQAFADRQEQLQLSRYKQATSLSGRSPVHRPTNSPWAWQSAKHTSIAVLVSPDSRVWVRVEHQNGSQKLLPWPAFTGWEIALPVEIGNPDHEVQGYAVKDIVQAMRLLVSLGYSEPKVGGWRDVLPKQSKHFSTLTHHARIT